MCPMFSLMTDANLINMDLVSNCSSSRNISKYLGYISTNYKRENNKSLHENRVSLLFYEKWFHFLVALIDGTLVLYSQFVGLYGDLWHIYFLWGTTNGFDRDVRVHTFTNCTIVSKVVSNMWFTAKEMFYTGQSTKTPPLNLIWID